MRQSACVGLTPLLMDSRTEGEGQYLGESGQHEA